MWNYDGETLKLLMFDHGDSNGPGAEWARTAQPGDELRLLKPEGDFTASPAGYHLLAGEETAQVAYGAMLRALPADVRVFGCLEVDSPGERLDLGEELNPNRNWDLDLELPSGPRRPVHRPSSTPSAASTCLPNPA